MLSDKISAHAPGRLDGLHGLTCLLWKDKVYLRGQWQSAMHVVTARPVRRSGSLRRETADSFSIQWLTDRGVKVHEVILLTIPYM